MAEQHQHWGVEALWQDLEPLLPGMSIEVLARTESTNTTLLERVRSEQRQRGSLEPNPYGRRAYDLQPCLLVAEHQTHGRGRMGRSWHATPGASLTFSLSLPLAPADWSGLSLVVGCAVAEALEPLAEGQIPRLALKWPNDLWLDGRKLGGVLIETVQAGGQRMAVVGVGLNILAAEPQSGETPSYSTGFASLAELEAGWTAPAALARIARPLIEALLAFPQQGFASWQARYARRDYLAGRAVMAGTQEGLVQGVNAQGELLLQTASGPQSVVSGEVSVRLAQAGAGHDGGR